MYKRYVKQLGRACVNFFTRHKREGRGRGATGQEKIFAQGGTSHYRFIEGFCVPMDENGEVIKPSI